MPVTLRGAVYTVVKPPPIDVCEDIAMRVVLARKKPGVPLVRLWAAMIAICVPEIGYVMGASVSDARRDLDDFGGDMLCKFRARKWTTDELADGFRELWPIFEGALLPSGAEVDVARGKSEAAAG